MAEDKTELFNHIAGQFEAYMKNINKNERLLKKITRVDKQNIGFAVRVLDELVIEQKQKDQFCDLVMQEGVDPIRDVLEPLLGVISAQIFALNSCDFKSDILENCKEYETFKNLFQTAAGAWDGKAFKINMLKAIWAPCSGMITDKMESELKNLRDDSDRQKLSISYADKLLNPFDNYLTTLTLDEHNLPCAKKRVAGVPILERVNALITAVDDVLESHPAASQNCFWLMQLLSNLFMCIAYLFKSRPSVQISPDANEREVAPTENNQTEPLLDVLNKFRQQLLDLYDGIQDRLKAGIPEIAIENSCSSDLRSVCNICYESIKEHPDKSTLNADKNNLVSEILRQLEQECNPSVNKEVTPIGGEHKSQDNPGSRNH